MKVRAYAKINLMLDILGKTGDGYHSLFMIMQSIGIYDDVTVELTNRPNDIDITCSNTALPCDKGNIVYKATEAFFKHMDKKPRPGVKIDIDKHIPFAAGLAGGSADAAATLVALNSLTGANLDIEELCSIGVKVGADVPFCLKGGTMVALDIGQVLAPLPPLSIPFIILTKPDQDVSTKVAFDAADNAEIRHCDKEGIIRALVTGNNAELFPRIKNVFEQFVEVPDRVSIKAIMRDHGCLATCMSGSGPSVYALFDSEIKARSALASLEAQWPSTFLCTPVPHGTEIISE